MESNVILIANKELKKIVLMRLVHPVPTHYLSENLVALGIKPRPLDL
jgi:hypothetical protein